MIYLEAQYVWNLILSFENEIIAIKYNLFILKNPVRYHIILSFLSNRIQPNFALRFRKYYLSLFSYLIFVKYDLVILLRVRRLVHIS